jgi:hypothetical protein
MCGPALIYSRLWTRVSSSGDCYWHDQVRGLTHLYRRTRAEAPARWYTEMSWKMG